MSDKGEPQLAHSTEKAMIGLAGDGVELLAIAPTG